MRHFSSAALLALTAMATAVAANDDVVDFSDQITPVCEVRGLLARPPAGWFNVPIESGEAQVAGCQMMLARESDDALGEVLWTRDSVPIQGQGFANGRAIGFQAQIEGNDTAQEAHFLMFDKADVQYIVTLLTPGRDVEESTFYQRNTADLGKLIRGFTVPRD